MISVKGHPRHSRVNFVPEYWRITYYLYLYLYYPSYCILISHIILNYKGIELLAPFIYVVCVNQLTVWHIESVSVYVWSLWTTTIYISKYLFNSPCSWVTCVHFVVTLWDRDYPWPSKTIWLPPHGEKVKASPKSVLCVPSRIHSEYEMLICSLIHLSGNTDHPHSYRYYRSVLAH